MSDDNPHSRSGSAAKSWLERIAAIFTAEPQDLSDLEDVIAEANSRNLIDTDTKGMLQGVLDVSKMRARDIMVPRSQMATIDIDQPLSEVAQLDQRALRVAVGVVLRIPAHVGELRVHSAQRLEVQRSEILHQHLTGIRIGHTTSVCESRASLPIPRNQRRGASSSFPKFDMSGIQAARPLQTSCPLIA